MWMEEALSLVYAVRLMRTWQDLARRRMCTRRGSVPAASSHTEWSRFSSLTRRASSSAINNSQASGPSAPAMFALRGWRNTTSEVSFCSKSGTQFPLQVDFHGVGRIARNPVNSQGVAAQQTHTQGFDVFGVPACVGVEGAARNPIPAHDVVFAAALGLTGSGEQHG